MTEIVDTSRHVEFIGRNSIQAFLTTAREFIAIQFPLDKKLPLTLVKNIVKFRMLENKEKKKSKT